MKTLEEAPSSLSEHRSIRRDVTLRAVRQWAGERRIGRARFTHVYEAAFLVAVSRLLQAIFRERHVPHARLWQNDAGHWFLDLGREPILRAPVSGPLPFRRLELTGFPWKIVAGRRRQLRSTRAFLNALRFCLEPSELAQYFDRLVSDFNNSFANLVTKPSHRPAARCRCAGRSSPFTRAIITIRSRRCGSGRRFDRWLSAQISVEKPSI